MTDLNTFFAEAVKMMQTPLKAPLIKLEEVGLSPKKKLTDIKQFIKYIVPTLIILNDLDPDINSYLITVVNSYFKKIGIKNEKKLSMMSDIKYYTEAKSDDEIEHINLLARMTFVQLSSITGTVCHHNYWFSNPLKILFLVDWHKQMLTISTCDTAAATPTTTPQQITSAIKFPMFELTKYSTFGDDVNKYIKAVEHDFTENKVISFLQEEAYADKYKDTSKAYCFTIFKLLIGSIHEYLILEHSKKLHNTAILWTTLSTTLTVTISEMTAVNTAWSKIHKLKCNYPEDFEMFFNNYINAELHLIKLKSTAIEDRCFLCSLIFHKIDMDDMKSDIALLLLEDTTKTAQSILDTLKKKTKARSLNNKIGYSVCLLMLKMKLKGKRLTPFFPSLRTAEIIFLVVSNNRSKYGLKLFWLQKINKLLNKLQICLTSSILTLLLPKEIIILLLTRNRRILPLLVKQLSKRNRSSNSNSNSNSSKPHTLMITITTVNIMMIVTTKMIFIIKVLHIIIIEIIMAIRLTFMHVVLLKVVVMITKNSDSTLLRMLTAAVVIPKVAIITSVGEMMAQQKILALLIKFIVSIHLFLYKVMKI